MTGHTKEPWRVEDEDCIWCSRFDDTPDAPLFKPDRHYRRWGRDVSNPEHAANAARIVACVNALATIPDPEAYIAAARGMREALGALTLRHLPDFSDTIWENAEEALRTFDAAQGEQ